MEACVSDEVAAVDPPVVPEVAPPPKEKGAAALMQITENGIQLRNLDDLLKFSRMIVEGGMAPSWAFAGVTAKDSGQGQAAQKAAAAVAIAIQAGLEHGLGIIGGLQAFVVIHGRLSWTGEAAAAKIRNSGKCVPGTLQFWSEGDGEKRRGIAEALRVGDKKPKRVEVTYADARQAGLINKDSWKNYPSRMFQWRALAWLAKDLFSDVLGGFPLAEESQDYEMPVIRREGRPAPALAPPSAPDPLLQSILGVRPHVEEKGAAVESPSPVASPLSQATVAAAPPFPSHAEADRAIAEQEQKGLFDK
jgi:hypothetical protein